MLDAFHLLSADRVIGLNANKLGEQLSVDDFGRVFNAMYHVTFLQRF